ncbi:MAG: hypothetical protein H0W61_15975 [Bacteroidetes bacterium]|nr:hypothetical protein [Bacteroidota bacterium]
MMNRVTSFISKLREVSTTSLFLKKHIPLPSTIRLLHNLYPSVDWSRVDFYEGLPWFTPLVAPYVSAQALPHFYSFSRYRIYLKKYDESRGQCIADIVHEAYHILQSMQFANGYGVGFFRGFMIYYNALFVKYGYRQNPFEITAYNQEYRFLEYCNKNGIAAISPPLKPDAFDDIKKESTLVFKNYPFRYTENYFVLAATVVFCLFVAVIKPVADLFVLCVSLFPTRRFSSEAVRQFNKLKQRAKA